LVADIDTGVDFGHPDLGGALVGGAALTSGSANPGTPSSPGSPNPDGTGPDAVMDDYGHGTLTTGIVVAATGNGTGIAGEAPGAHALVMKVFSNKGAPDGYSAYSSDVESAIVWAVQHGARVINLSLGPSVPLVGTALGGDQMPGFVQWASQHGAAVAIAAGNTYIPAADYIGISRYALVVGALGPSGAVASYSQHGVGVNIYAPGGDGPGGNTGSDVISTFPTYPLPAANQPLGANVAPGYAAYDGTSFATPYAAGVLALLMAHGYSADQARQRVLQSARSVGGIPVVDAPAALGACTAGSNGGAGGGGAGGGGSGVGQAGSHTSATQPAGPAVTPSVQATASANAAAGGPNVANSHGTHSPTTGAGAPAHAGGSSPLLLAGLGLLVVLGGPAVLVLRRRIPPRTMRR
jgi:subtilisin family serine protease